MMEIIAAISYVLIVGTISALVGWFAAPTLNKVYTKAYNRTMEKYNA